MPKKRGGGGPAKAPQPKPKIGGRPKASEDSYARKIETRGAATTASQKVAKQYAKKASAPAMKKEGTGKARRYLVKSSGTTKGEVRGVMGQLRSGKISKGAAIKALKGGPKAGLPAGNKKKVAKAIRKAR
jgi:hypothetical protein